MFIKKLLLFCFTVAGVCYGADELESYTLMRSEANGFKMKIERLTASNGTVQCSVMRSILFYFYRKVKMTF